MKAIVLIALTPFLAAAQTADSFGTCPSTSTLREDYDRGQAVILGRWISAEAGTKPSRGTTIYEIVEVTRSPSEAHVRGARIVFDLYHAGKPGSLALLMGTTATSDGKLQMYRPVDVTEVSYRYIQNAPAVGASLATRFSYYAKFLEHAEAQIANDAFRELGNFAFRELIPLAEQFPRERLRRWILDPKVPGGRLGLYGQMLGLCGQEEDAVEIQKNFVLAAPHEYRYGIDGVLFGYLLLTGERGLALLEENRIKRHDIILGEAYAAVQAIRFYSRFGNGKISQDRLIRSMRLVLDRPDMADLAVGDLARSKDWSVQNRLMELYGTPEYDNELMNRAIIRYMIASIADVPQDAADNLPPHAIQGTKYLAQLRERDATSVTYVEKQVERMRAR